MLSKDYKKENANINSKKIKKFLIVVDMQHDFIDGSLGSTYAKEKVLPRVLQKIKENRDHRDILIFTRDIHSSDYLDTFEGKHLPVEHCIRNTPGQELHSDILDSFDPQDELRCCVVDKSTFGSISFSSPGKLDLKKAIESYLAPNELFELEFCGLCTDICVVSNALLARAFWPGIDIKVDASACGGTSKEAHDAALIVMKSCQIDIINED